MVPTAGWRDGAAEPSRRQLVAAAVLMLFCVAGAFVGLLLLIRPPTEPLFVSVPIGEYADPGWPVNPWADQDAELLAARFHRPGREPDGVKAFSYQQADRLRALLDWVAGRSSVGTDLPTHERHRPLILHVSALAACREGRVYLLAGNARHDDLTPPPGSKDLSLMNGWVDIRDVLTAVDAWPIRHKFLILDLAHPTADPFGGQLLDDVATRLDAILQETPPSFPVLTSCGPGERSLPADLERCSAFAFYLAEGLGGAADGYSVSGHHDGEVSIRELAAFTTARVDRWARLTHGRRQIPVLHGPTDPTADFVLTRRLQWQPTDPEPAGAYPDWLKDAWAEAHVTARGPGVLTARLKAGLLLTEQRWLHPGPARRAEDVWVVTRDELVAPASSSQGSRGEDWTALAQVVDRLAVARLNKPTPPPELVKALDGFLAAKAEQELDAEKSWITVASPAPAAAVQVVWERARETDRPTPEMIARWARLVVLANPVKPFAETRLLSTLADQGSFRRQKLATYPSHAVAALIRAEDEIGQVAALGPEEFPTGRAALAAALPEYRAGREALFSADTSGRIAAAVVSLGRARTNFAAARNQIERTRETRRSLAAAAITLGDTLPGMTESGRPTRDAWVAVAETATRVAGSDPARADAQDLLALTQGTAAIRQDFDPKILATIAGKDRRRDVANVGRLREFLAVTTLPGPARKQAWDALLTDAAGLHSAVRALDAADDADRSQTPTPVSEPGANRELDRGLRRADASVRLLQLAGAPGADQANALLRRIQIGDRTGWDLLGRHLMGSWLKGLPARARSSQNLATIERILRAIPPELARYQAWSVDFPTPPRDDFRIYKDWAMDLAQYDPKGESQ